MRILLTLLALLLNAGAWAAEDSSGVDSPGPDSPGPDSAMPEVCVQTNYGRFTVTLWPDRAPESTKNFLSYIDYGFYEGLIFHRVIPYFMVQTGGFDAELNYRDPFGPVRNESVRGPKNLRGTLAMARQRDPDSADSQFFINLVDNAHLDAEDDRPGYTVFGEVTDGMAVIDRIGEVETTVKDGMRDVPRSPVTIEKTTRGACPQRTLGPR